jgi:hypothetical protein
LAHEVLRAIDGVEHIVNELEIRLKIGSHGGEAETAADAKQGFDWADTALLTCQMGRRIGMVIETVKAPA